MPKSSIRSCSSLIRWSDLTASDYSREVWAAALRQLAENPSLKLDDGFLEKPGQAVYRLYRAWLSQHSHEASRDALHKEIEKSGRAVASLNHKLAGRMFMSARDMINVVATIIQAWTVDSEGRTTPMKGVSDELALSDQFVRQLLYRAAGGDLFENLPADDIRRIRHDPSLWNEEELRTRALQLLESRISARRLLKLAGRGKGALIVASAEQAIMGYNPISRLHEFRGLLDYFMKDEALGYLIWVIDMGPLTEIPDSIQKFVNLASIQTAIKAYAMLSPTRSFDLNQWNKLQHRVCIVVKNATVISQGGEFRRGADAASELESDSQQVMTEDAAENARANYPSLQEMHFLPREVPTEWIKRLGKRRLHDEAQWNVWIQDDEESLKVAWYVTPKQEISVEVKQDTRREASREKGTRRGRPEKFTPIEGEAYLINIVSPDNKSYDKLGYKNKFYDDAQKLIYQAARYRLNGQKTPSSTTDEGPLAVALLRNLGFEVLPISDAMKLLTLPPKY